MFVWKKKYLCKNAHLMTQFFEDKKHKANVLIDIFSMFSHKMQISNKLLPENVQNVHPCVYEIIQVYIYIK